MFIYLVKKRTTQTRMRLLHQWNIMLTCYPVVKVKTVVFSTLEKVTYEYELIKNSFKLLLCVF